MARNQTRKYEDEKVIIVISGDDCELAQAMAKKNGFPSVQAYLEIQYKNALRTYRRQQAKEN